MKIIPVTDLTGDIPGIKVVLALLALLSSQFWLSVSLLFLSFLLHLHQMKMEELVYDSV